MKTIVSPSIIKKPFILDKILKRKDISFFYNNTFAYHSNISLKNKHKKTGEERIELSITVLETAVMPLNYSPKKQRILV